MRAIDSVLKRGGVGAARVCTGVAGRGLGGSVSGLSLRLGRVRRCVKRMRLDIRGSGDGLVSGRSRM